MQKKTAARIGMVNFINTAPLYDVWKRTVHRPEWRITEAPPTALNRMLFNNELDLGFISSHEYAVHPFQYRILSDLSISATGAVGSVFLFSMLKPHDLSGKRVLLSSKSKTSAGLTKIILEEFYQVTPRYMSGEVLPDSGTHHSDAGNKTEERVSAVLAIGDDAIRLDSIGDYPVRLDLSEVWRRHTGLPFVFAVWAVREDFLTKHSDCVNEIHQQLLYCISTGKNELFEISRRVAPKIPMSQDDCFAYLSGIEYDLKPDKQKALNLFFEYLIKRDEGAPDALPLKIC
ncbi:MAG: menaquinone biosynthesis protein [Thermodesulfobacteriota bacterium]|nr:menaquinone biosynthesis protein [Thermodesulfobacteriota bacterium]